MIPIIYESSETDFISNGLGRLRDCLSCEVTEERNGIYECEFEYPVDGANYNLIQCGRIIAVTHDETGDVEPFDIVSYSKPISGVVSFHAVHISYRQRGIVASGTNINSLADAFAVLTSSAQPSNPFTYSADFTSSAYASSFDGTPRSVRQFLGGIEGSILDAYGGEYEFDKFRVILHKSRGQVRDFVIRYGVNLLDYKDDTDYSETYTSCVPYWHGNDNVNKYFIPILNKADISLWIAAHKHIWRVDEPGKVSDADFPVVINDDCERMEVTATRKGVSLKTFNPDGKQTHSYSTVR